MGLAPASEEWIDRIAAAVEDQENFSSTPAHREALREIFEELERHGGRAAVEELGEVALETVELGRHPTTGRLRRYARELAVYEFDADLKPTSPLLKSRNG